MEFDIPTLLVGIASSVVFSMMVPKLRTKRATCSLMKEHSGTVSGSIELIQLNKTQVKARCNISGLSPGNHGLHVHRCADFSDGCKSTCEHYNPEGKPHGGPTGPNRHKGDFGNIYANESGICTSEIIADVTIDEIAGRSFIVHAGEDDLGLGDSEESRKTGNAGDRIACGVIRKLY